MGYFLFSAYIGKVEVLESAAGLVLEQEREGRRERQRVPRKTEDCGLSNWRGGVAISWASDNWGRTHLL